MIIPLEDEHKNQKIYFIKKINKKIYKEPLISVRFVPLVDGKN
jgi:Protein-L-isoaspartate(D-aspartate) O-methyltransferase (PCMT).